MPPFIHLVTNQVNYWPGYVEATFITSLRDSNGITKSIPKEVNRVMLQYYTSLYAHKPINKHHNLLFPT